MLKEPKVYFYDSGFVDGDSKGRDITRHFIRTKDGKEVGFCLAEIGGVSLVRPGDWLAQLAA